MSKSWGEVKNKEAKQTADYHMYSNGKSYWGLGMINENELPIKCTEREHKMTLEEKIKWYKEQKKQ
jgi:hypothetical protein